jgi:DNA invertase Pin-like site-specific DNA recombinase
MATYGYARVSTIGQVDGTSLSEQERKLNAVAEARGEPLARVFVEEAVSGAMPLNERPKGRELYAALQPGDTLIVMKLDRLFRNTADALERTADWKRRGIHLISVDLGLEPITGNGVGKFVFTLLAAFAEMERERIAERVLEGKRAKRAKGGHIGGTAPFGWRVVGSGKDARLEPVQREQEAIRTIRRGRETGMSHRALAELAKDVHGVQISHEAIRKMLLDTNPRSETAP